LSTLMEEPVRVATLAGWIIATGALAASLGSVIGGKLAARFGAHIPQVRVAAEVFCGAWTKQRMFHA
ncbi:MAG: hypothetical protein ACRDN7_08070, partial [Rubrobacter sp.]